MEYRLVKKGKKILVYNEENSELVCNILEKRHFLFLKKYILQFNSREKEGSSQFLSKQKWKIGNSYIRRKLSFFGATVNIIHGGKRYSANDFQSNKMNFKEENQGRTGLIINNRRLAVKDSVIIEDYDRIPLYVNFLATILCMKWYKMW